MAGALNILVLKYYYIHNPLVSAYLGFSRSATWDLLGKIFQAVCIKLHSGKLIPVHNVTFMVKYHTFLTLAQDQVMRFMLQLLYTQGESHGIHPL
jgi:hypothetical protein